MKGLLIKQPWIDLILKGEKIWEVRNSNSHIRGKIALIQSGSGTIVGMVELVDCFPLTAEDIQQNFDKHQIPEEILRKFNYDKPHAWIFQNPVRLEAPIPYRHPLGAVIWVNVHDFT